MIIDSRLEVSNAQALTASADSTNVIDLTQTAVQVGKGQPLWMYFNVVVAADGTTTDETYTFNVSTGAATTLGTVLASRTIGYATLVAGYRFRIAIPDTGMLRYLGAEYVLGGTTPSITIDAHVSGEEMAEWEAYADAI